ncbi:MAG: hypothetical protein KGM47_00870 [Acidobacteriota bacterium]|nr:hypothetical protein [Acidobacteriota bacterium]
MSTDGGSEKQTVLLFSHGGGSGHAMPDMAIADELQKIRSDIDLKFVSYGTGPRTLAALRKKHGIWVCLAGESLSEALTHKTLREVRRERDEANLGLGR